MSTVINLFIRNNNAGNLYSELYNVTLEYMEYISLETVAGVIAGVILDIQLVERGVTNKLLPVLDVNTNWVPHEISYRSAIVTIINNSSDKISTVLQVGILRELDVDVSNE